MKRQTFIGLACSAALVVAASSGRVHASATVQETASKAPAPTEAQTEAAKASPELVSELSKEMGSTPEQAAGAAGALFGLAKSRLKADEFSQVSSAVPGMSALLGAAPAAAGGAIGTSGAAGAVAGAAAGAAGSASGLASAASAFSKLGLSPDMVSKAVPVLTSYVTKSGGASVGNLLAGALK